MLTYTSNVREKICILRVRVCMYMQGGKGVQLKRSAVDRGSLWRAARFRCATLCQLYSHIPNLCTCTYVRNGRSWLNKGCMDNIVCAALHSSSTFVTASRYIFVGITTFAISFIPFRPLSLIFLYRTFVSLSSSLFISSPFIFFHFFFFYFPPWASIILQPVILLWGKKRLPSNHSVSMKCSLFPFARLQ